MHSKTSIRIKQKSTIFIGAFLFLAMCNTYSQVIYLNSNSQVYDFLDEMANLKLIELNSAIKPYSRSFVYSKLSEIKLYEADLNRRQKQELNFYLKDFFKDSDLMNDSSLNVVDYALRGWFNKQSRFFLKNRDLRHDLLFVKDKNFRITANPVVGASVFQNENGVNITRYNGFQVDGYIGKNFSFYTGLVDNFEKSNLSSSRYLTQSTGGYFKNVPNSQGSVEFSDVRGGLFYKWKFGYIGIVKDHVEWGEGYNGNNIFSKRSPSPISLRLNIEPTNWLELNYTHSWLNSGLVDSSQTYFTGNLTTDRAVLRRKYVAANMLTFKPVNNLFVGIGNSIVYGDINLHPGFLIPLFFYKSIDHAIHGRNNVGGNSQMFFSLSSRNIKKLHLHSTLFVDEIRIRTIFDDDLNQNWFSIKSGFRISDFLFDNLWLTFEYTRNNPNAFEHFIPVTTFENNGFNMGHYLRQNSDDLHLKLTWFAIQKLRFDIAYTHARKGRDDPYILPSLSRGTPFLEEIMWESRNINFSVNYQIFNETYINLMYNYRNVVDKDGIYTPSYFMNRTNTFSLGFNYGF